MMRALFSGVTGLRSHQTRMDVIGNNIANVNTMGYKKMTTTFKDLYNETISSAASSSGVGGTATGGVNAKQIGLGAAVGAISAIHTPGSAQYTGNAMDVAISGDGYFAVLTPTGIKYTRAGEFATDLTGNFVTKEGYYVLTVEPRLSASESLKVPENGVNVNGLLNQAAGIRGVAHTGNITADLAEVEGQDFSIAYEPADEPWSTRYVGDTTDDYYPDSPTTVVKGIDKSHIDVKAITEVIKTMAADPTQNVKIGTNEITFAYDDKGELAEGQTTINLGTQTFAVGDVLTITLADGSTIQATCAGIDQATNYATSWTVANPAGYTAELTMVGGTNQAVLKLTADDVGQRDNLLAGTTASVPTAETVAVTKNAVQGQATVTLNDVQDGDVIEFTDADGRTLQSKLTVANGQMTWGAVTGVPAGYTATFDGATLTVTADPTGTGNAEDYINGLEAEAVYNTKESFTSADTNWDVGLNPGLNMMYGDLVVGTADISTIPTANTETPITFTSEDGTNTTLGVITVNSPTALDSKDLVDGVLNKMADKPMITLEENGQWVLKRGNVTVESIVMEYSDNVNGGILGDVQFNTASYGSFLFEVETDLNGNIMPNQQALSQALNGTFTIAVETEYLPNYTVPAIITADSLKTLTIDFDRYTNVSIDTTGAILGQLKNDEQWEVDGQTINMEAGDKAVLGYISMATFNNPSGLEKVGDNMFEVSANSGNPVYGTPGNGSAGSLAPSNLEMSNVDLSEEMVNMIITQRGFQANSRIITTTDTMLEELVNLKR